MGQPNWKDVSWEWLEDVLSLANMVCQFAFSGNGVIVKAENWEVRYEETILGLPDSLPVSHRFHMYGKIRAAR